MRRPVLLLTVLATLLSFGSCQNGPMFTAEFAQQVYTIYPQSSVEVTMNIDRPLAEDEVLEIPVNFGGTAERGTDYTLTPDSEWFVFTPGSPSSTITVTDKGMTDGKQIVMVLGDGPFHQSGTKYLAVITLDGQEDLLYGFSTTEMDLIESAEVEITLTGTKSWDRFRAPEDLRVPVKVSGDFAENVQISADHFLVKKGTNSAKISLSVKPSEKLEAAEEDPEVLLDVDYSGTRFVPGIVGTYPGVKIRLHSGLQVPERLLGTWEFSEIYGAEDEYPVWFEGYEGLPLDNEGFTMTFYEIFPEDGKDRKVVMAPGKGDFAWFFRESTFEMTAPMNICPSYSKVLGKYTSLEGNMFMLNVDGMEPEVFTHYRFDKVNRLFSATEERIGSAVVAIAMVSDNEFHMMFKDYDRPPFFSEENDWMGWYDPEDFDADMLGFACKFVKKTE